MRISNTKPIDSGSKRARRAARRLAPVATGLLALAVAVATGRSGRAEPTTGSGSSGPPGVSGQVVNAIGQPIAGVTVTLAGSSDAVQVTGADGSYSFANLAAGSYSVRPTLANCAFVPDVVNLNNLATSVVQTFDGSGSGCGGTNATLTTTGSGQSQFQPGSFLFAPFPSAYEVAHPTQQEPGTDAPPFGASGNSDPGGDVVDPVEGPSPSITTTIPGFDGFFPPDADVAAGPKQLIVAEGLEIKILTRNFSGGVETTPTVSATRSMSGLFSVWDSAKNISGYNDSRVTYDYFRNRFVVSVLAYGTNSDGSASRFAFIATSADSDLNDGFYQSEIDAVESPTKQTGDTTDYDTIAASADAVVESHFVNNAGVHRYDRVAFVPPSGLVTNGTFTYTYVYQLFNPDGTTVASLVEPAVQHTDSSGSFLATRFNNQIVWWAVSTPLTAYHDTRFAVTASAFTGPLDATQSGSTNKIEMSNMGNELLRAVVRNDALYVVANDAHDWGGGLGTFTSIRLIAINLDQDDIFIDRTFGGFNQVTESSNLRFYYGWPGLDVNGASTVGIPYARSGATIDPEVRYTIRYADESDVRSSVLLQAGQTAYRSSETSPFRWGDLAGASVDPLDDKSFWFAQQYAASVTGNFNFQIAIGKVTP